MIKYYKKLKSNILNFKENFKIREIAKFPSTQRDFALLLDKSVSFESIVELSKKTEQNILDSVDLFDVYEGNEIPNGKKSYGIRFTFLDKRKTLTDNYIDKVMNKLKSMNSIENQTEDHRSFNSMEIYENHHLSCQPP